MLCERFQKLIHTAWRILQTCSLALRRGAYGTGIQVDQVRDELVRMLDLDSERLQRRLRKIAQIERDDDRCSSPNGRSEHVSIVRIRQDQAVDQ